MKPVVLSPGLGDNPPKATLYYGQDVRETLRELPEASVHTVCTSPPYWGLRDYGTGDAQIGLEPTPEEYVEKIVEVFREVARVLRPDGTLWVNLGDSYSAQGGQANAQMMNKRKDTHREAIGAGGGRKPPPGLKPKDLVGIPWRVAFALQEDGWYLRSDIIWAKSACMPESIRDRPTKAHEYVFLFAHPDSGGRYYYDQDAIREPHSDWTLGLKNSAYRQRQIEAMDFSDETERVSKRGQQERGGVGSTVYKIDVEKGRNKRSWWNINPKPYPGAHFAVWPPDLVEPMVKAGCPDKGVVLDPFSGSATTGMVALQLGRDYIGIDLNTDYLKLAQDRILGRSASHEVGDDSDDESVFDLFGEDL